MFRDPPPKDFAFVRQPAAPRITTYLTTPVYPINVVEAVTGQLISASGRFEPNYSFLEGVAAAGCVLISGTLREANASYDFWAPEAIEGVGCFVIAGQLRDAYKSYSTRPEAIEGIHCFITSGVLRAALITYSNYPAEAIEGVSCVITGGSLT